MSAISQKEYLKKYLGIGKAPGEKKKKKKKPACDRLKIIDDDADMISQEIQEDISAANEDAPQIVAVIDERPPSMRIDEQTKNNLWKPIGATEDESEIKTLKLSTSFKLGRQMKSGGSNSAQSSSKFSFNQHVNKSDYAGSTIRIKEEIDLSPKRSRDGDMSPLRGKRGKDYTPPRSAKSERDVFPQRQNDALSRRSNTPDNSPPRRRDSSPRRRDDDKSPPRKRGRDQSPLKKRYSNDDSRDVRSVKIERDISPQRQNDSLLGRNNTPDISPPRKRDDDNSPPRKRDDDNSPPRRRNHDNSPPRQKHKEQISSSKKHDSDYSPSRKRGRDESPPRDDRATQSSKNRKEEDSSPPRKPDRSPVRQMYRDDNSPRRKTERDTSPSKRKTNDLSPPRRTNKEKDSFSRNEDPSDMSPPRRRHHKDTSPNRRNKEKSNKRKNKESRWGDWSPETPSTSSPKPEKMKATLDGKKAGLQNARDLVEETTVLKRKEEEIFKNMSAEVSGRNAATVVRAKKSDRDPEEEARKLERERQTKEKYDRWGKGIKQTEDQNERIADQLHEMNKPLARYADDEDLEKYLKEQEREGDPMLNYIRKKKKKHAVAAGVPEKPMYMGEFMPNRFGIRPGYRWDGVDRSNGYEKKWFEVQNAKKASQEEALKWSTEDM